MARYVRLPRHNRSMHPDNAYRASPPDFAALADKFERFRRYVTWDPRGFPRLDWKDPSAQRELTRTLLQADFGINYWEIPENRLIPPVPSRLNYILWIHDLLGTIRPEGPAGAAALENLPRPELHGLPSREHVRARPPSVTAGEPGVQGIDIGTGASAIYPLLGHQVFGWQFVATEADEESSAAAARIVERNGLEQAIRVVSVQADDFVARPLAQAEPHPEQEAREAGSAQAEAAVPWHFSMCNPPFFDTPSDAGSNPWTVCTGSQREVAYPGGEVAFLEALADDSARVPRQVVWFTTMVGKKQTLSILKRKLRVLGATCIRTTTFAQGKTLRWGIAWSFFPAAETFSPEPSNAGLQSGQELFIVRGATWTDTLGRLCDALGTTADRGSTSSSSDAWSIRVPLPATDAGAADGAGDATTARVCATDLTPRDVSGNASRSSARIELSLQSCNPGRDMRTFVAWSGRVRRAVMTPRTMRRKRMRAERESVEGEDDDDDAAPDA